jgi:Protein of unknown function (DUF3043)
MLGRRSSVTEETPEQTLAALQAPAGKGRPTPKRSESRKARRNTAPKDRKEAAALQRDKARAQRRIAREALVTGDERNLPARDAGPEKSLARDVVDSRFTAGQVLFYLIFGGFVLGIINEPFVKVIADIVALASLLLLVADGVRTGRRAKQAVEAKFNVVGTGIASYAFMRAMLPRRFRRPPPKVARGTKVG